MENYIDPDIQSLKTGDIYAFEKLFRHYYPLLVVFAMKYVTDKDIAREIVQDFFARLFEKKQSLTIETSLKSYLYRSVHNSCINYINQRSLHDRHLKKLDQEKDVSEDPDRAFLITELQQKINEVVEQLPSQCRKIFKMNRYEGLKNEEIAETLNLSRRTVETQISKALKILRNRLSDAVPVALLLFFYFQEFVGVGLHIF